MRGAALAAALLFAAAPAAAQEVSPEQVLARTVVAAKAGDWDGYAAQMHPEALAGARRIFMPVVEADPSGKVATTFFGASPAELAKASDREVFVRLFKGLARTIPAYAEAIASSEMEPIGTIYEPPELVHVVYRFRSRAESIGIERTQVASLKKHQGAWKLMLTASIEGIAARLKQLAPR